MRHMSSSCCCFTPTSQSIHAAITQAAGNKINTTKKSTPTASAKEVGTN
jgi:hypothetical protein